MNMVRSMIKFLKSLLVILVTILTIISLFAYTVIDSTEVFFSEESITDMIKQIDITEILGEEVKNKIYETLEKTGMPSEYADYVLESDEFKEYVGQYISEGIEYVIYDKEVPRLDEKETTEMLVTSFNRVIEEANRNGISVDKYITKEEQAKIVEKIEVYTPEVMEKLPEIETLMENKLSEHSEYQDAKNKLEEAKSQLQTTIDNIQKVYTYKKIVFVMIIIELILLILLGLKKLKFMKNIGIVFGLNALMLFLLNSVINYGIDKYYPQELDVVRSTFDIIVLKIQSIWTKIEIRYLLVFVISIFLYIIICIIKKRKVTVDNMKEEDKLI